MAASAGKIASVVQGASRGIGLAITKRLLAVRDPQSHIVVATCRNPDVASELRELAATNSHLLISRLDVTDESSMKTTVENVKQHASKVEILVNSAGILKPETQITRVTEEQLMETFRINTFGPLLVAKHFTPMISKGSRIVNLSARVGSITENNLGGWYSYRASKTALNMFTKCLAAELGRKGAITVSVHPGSVDTDMTRAYHKGMNPNQVLSPQAAAEHIVRLIESLEDSQNGKFLQYDGGEIPW